MTPNKLSYIWMAAGVVLLIIGLIGLFTGSVWSLINVAIAALIIYTAVFQIGGWPYVKTDIIMYFKGFKRVKKAPKKKRDHLKTVK